MKKADSIVIRLTGMVFILIFLTIAILLILVNNQMDNHFLWITIDFIFV